MAITKPPSFPLDADRAGALERALEEALAGGTQPPELNEAARYVMGWVDETGAPSDARGKRLRPALCLVVCESLGGSFDQGLPGAVAVELVHNFSLVHDEIQDRDSERHGRPTLWRRIGAEQAINVGDFLYTAGLSALATAAAAPERRTRALAALLRAVANMVGGQWDDLAFEKETAITPDAYLGMVAGKTGALLAAAAEIGAILAGSTPATIEALARWGSQAGLAFQIRDDYLGLWGDPGTTGKSNTNDVERRKKSFPIVIGLADPEARETIIQEYGRPDRPDAARVMAALDHCGAREKTQQAAEQLASSARRLLAELPLGPRQQELLQRVSHLLIDRQV